MFIEDKMMSNIITVELSRPVKFTPDGSGEQVDGDFVTLREPTCAARELEICAYFKQAFFQASASLVGAASGQSGSTTKGDDIKGSDLVYMMYASSATDMPKALEKAKELFKIVGKIADKKLLTDSMLSSMAQDDIDKLLGEFLVNFTLRSVLSSQ